MSPDELPLEAEEFLVWLSAERGRARNTVQAYRRDLLQYQEWLQSRGLSPLTVGHDDLTQLVAERRATDAATSSIARQIDQGAGLAGIGFAPFAEEVGAAAEGGGAEDQCRHLQP